MENIQDENEFYNQAVNLTTSDINHSYSPGFNYFVPPKDGDFMEAVTQLHQFLHED